MTEQKIDKRVARTKTRLKEGLADLMTRKSIQEITVKELVEYVHINRSTFYLHYSDISNMLENVKRELIEEIAEVMSQVSLKQLKAPCILYNLNGYYDHLKALLEHMIEKGLSSPDRQQGIHFAAGLAEIQEILRQA